MFSHDNWTKLIVIKTLHTLIWAIMVSIIGIVLWSGMTGNISIYSWLAVGTVCMEGLVLVLFKGNCPLTIIARRLSQSDKANFDIFLPEWLARYNKEIFTTLFGIGLILILLRYFF